MEKGYMRGNLFPRRPLLSFRIIKETILTAQKREAPTRAVVLGGGGVTGIAWEVGILAGLHEAGIILREADAIIGTSAGAFVGAALASGYDLDTLFSAQSEATDAEIAASASKETMALWYGAFKIGGDDPRKVGAAFGDIARKIPEPVPVSKRRSAVEARLVTTDWPAKLKVTAIDADTGQLTVFDRESGVPLIDAVSASGAVPGVWPIVHLNGRSWIDGGMVSTTNARLAEGYGRIVILAPIPAGFGLIPGAAQDAEALRGHADVFLTAPDKQSIAAIGPNMYDPTRRSGAANAGRAQGRSIAAEIGAMW